MLPSYFGTDFYPSTSPFPSVFQTALVYTLLISSQSRAPRPDLPQVWRRARPWSSLVCSFP